MFDSLKNYLGLGPPSAYGDPAESTATTTTTTTTNTTAATTTTRAVGVVIILAVTMAIWTGWELVFGDESFWQAVRGAVQVAFIAGGIVVARNIVVQRRSRGGPTDA